VSDRVLVLGVGNILMGDEGVGVEVVLRLADRPLPAGVTCLDGGTGSLVLLDPMLEADRIVLIDASADGKPVGTLACLRPRFSKDYPRRITAHDIGLKDLLDAFYLMGKEPDVTLFTISIEFPQEVGVGLSEPLRDALPSIVARIDEALLPGSRVGEGETWGGTPARPIPREEMEGIKASIR
jgi:hydrogenase maturation protease